jgi:hypothetical protein
MAADEVLIRVVDREGAAIPDARCVAFRVDGDIAVRVADSGPGDSFRVVCNGSMLVGVSAPGCAAHVIAIGAESSRTLCFDRAAHIVGKVVDERDQAAPNAAIEIMPNIGELPRAERRRLVSPASRALTDMLKPSPSGTSGEFEVDVQPVRVEVLARPPDGIPGLSGEMTPAPGSTVAVGVPVGSAAARAQLEELQLWIRQFLQQRGPKRHWTDHQVRTFFAHLNFRGPGYAFLDRRIRSAIEAVAASREKDKEWLTAGADLIVSEIVFGALSGPLPPPPPPSSPELEELLTLLTEVAASVTSPKTRDVLARVVSSLAESVGGESPLPNPIARVHGDASAPGAPYMASLLKRIALDRPPQQYLFRLIDNFVRRNADRLGRRARARELPDDDELAADATAETQTGVFATATRRVPDTAIIAAVFSRADRVAVVKRAKLTPGESQVVSWLLKLGPLYVHEAFEPYAERIKRVAERHIAHLFKIRSRAFSKRKSTALAKLAEALRETDDEIG